MKPVRNSLLKLWCILPEIRLAQNARDTEKQVQSLGQEDPLEEEMATHSNILAWKIPWTEEPGWLQPMGSQRVEHSLESEHTQSFSSHLSGQVNCHGIIVLVFK